MRSVAVIGGGPAGLMAAKVLIQGGAQLDLYDAIHAQLDEAISSAGGVAFEALDERLMLNKLPGVFCAGEMLD